MPNTKRSTNPPQSQTEVPTANTAKISSKTDRRQKVQSAEIGLLVLSTISALGGSASITALSTRLQEPASKVHRYLASLVNSGFVFQDAGSLRYILGPESISLGLAAMRQSDPISWSASELPDICEKLSAVCFVSCMGSHGPVVVRWHEPQRPVVVNVRVGSVLPILWSATGRAFGAFAASTQVDGLIERELKDAPPERRRLIPNERAARVLFQSFQEKGYAWVNDLLLQGVSSIAAPVYSGDGEVRAVITALGMSTLFETGQDKEPAKLVVEAARLVSKRLGSRKD